MEEIREKQRILKGYFITHWEWWALLATLLFSAYVRYRLLAIPLERDEGEYAYAGQLILQGIPPYLGVYNMKLPGVYAAYAAILALFGQTISGIHLGLLLINAITTFMIFLVGKRLSNTLAGVVAAASFALLSLGQSIHGLSANAEHFVIIAVVAGLLLLLRAIRDDRPWLLFTSGLMFGIGFLMKQHGAVFAAFALIYVLVRQLGSSPVNWRRIMARESLLITGTLIPYLLTCLLFVSMGLFGRFWFWTVKYALSYTAEVPLGLAWADLKYSIIKITREAPLIWTLAFLGLTALAWNKKARKNASFMAGLLVFSFLATCPGLYFRTHYFILVLPAASLLAGLATSAIHNRLNSLEPKALRHGIIVLVVLTCLGVSVYQQRDYLFHMTPVQACRATYGLNPFPEAIEIGKFIHDHTEKDDRIAIIGSEPEIYFYSKRQAATGYVYMYPLMETHAYALHMQKDMIGEIESSRPEFIVFVNVYTSWLVFPGSHRYIFKWFKTYQRKHYSLVGLADMSQAATTYSWAPLVKWPPTYRNWIAVYERIN